MVNIRHPQMDGQISNLLGDFDHLSYVYIYVYIYIHIIHIYILYTYIYMVCSTIESPYT